MKQFDKDGDGRLNDEERAEAMKALKDKTADLEQMRKKFAQEIIAKFRQGRRRQTRRGRAYGISGRAAQGV